MNKKYPGTTLIFATAILFTATAFINLNKTTEAMDGDAKRGFALVELFTSEGCSSCPSADETVARLLAKNIANVYILAYHVDYWDRLGWKDPFSQAAFSKRQREYATAFNLSSVYTPQVVVNGATEFVGSDEANLTAVIDKSLNNKPEPGIEIDAKRNGQTVTVNYNIEGNELVLLNLALVQSRAVTSVKKGENGGKTLHHVNVVRLLNTIDARGKGTVVMDIPGELSDVPLNIVAFTQGRKSFKVLAAEQKAL